MGKKISPQNSFLLGAIEFNAVYAYITVGDLASAEASLAKVSEEIVSFDSMIQKIFLAKAKALIARHRGRLDQSEAIINQVQQDLGSQGLCDKPEAFFLHRHLGYIFTFRTNWTKLGNTPIKRFDTVNTPGCLRR